MYHHTVVKIFFKSNFRKTTHHICLLKQKVNFFTTLPSSGRRLKHNAKQTRVCYKSLLVTITENVMFLSQNIKSRYSSESILQP